MNYQKNHDFVTANTLWEFGPSGTYHDGSILQATLWEKGVAEEVEWDPHTLTETIVESQPVAVVLIRLMVWVNPDMAFNEDSEQGWDYLATLIFKLHTALYNQYIMMLKNRSEHWN